MSRIQLKKRNVSDTSTSTYSSQALRSRPFENHNQSYTNPETYGFNSDHSGNNFSRVDVLPRKGIIQPKLTLGQEESQGKEADSTDTQAINPLQNPNTHLVQQPGNMGQYWASRLQRKPIEKVGDRSVIQCNKDTTNQTQNTQSESTETKDATSQTPNTPTESTETEENKAAIAHPETYVREKANNNWFEVKKQYKEGKLLHQNNSKSEPYGMQKLLDYRSHITQELLQEVKPLAEKNEKEKRAATFDKTHGMSKEQIENANRIRAARKLDPIKTSKEDKEKFINSVKPLNGNAPGSTDPTSDIDVNMSGDGTEFAVSWLNATFREKYGDGRESGVVYDVNFYAKDFVPGEALFGDQGLIKSGKLDKKDGEKFHQDWRLYKPEDKKVKEEEITDQTIASLVMIRVNMEHDLGIWKEYVAIASKDPEMKAMLIETEKRYLERHKTIENAKGEVRQSLGNEGYQLKSIEQIEGYEKLSEMAAENRAYKKILLEEVEPKRIKFELLKQSGAKKIDIDKAYLELKKAKTKALMFANEAYYTEGAVVGTVTNRQQLGRMYKPKKEFDSEKGKAGKKKLKLTVDEHYHSFNEQFGFAFHALNDVNTEDESKFYVDISKPGKYIHRAYSAMKYMYIDLGKNAPFKEEERRAASDWEGVKQGKEYVPEQGYTKDMEDKQGAMKKVLEAFEVSGDKLENRILKIKQKLMSHKKTTDQHYLTYLKQKNK